MHVYLCNLEVSASSSHLPLPSAPRDAAEQSWVCKRMELMGGYGKTHWERHLLTVNICLHWSLSSLLGAAAKSCFTPAPGRTTDQSWAGDIQPKMSPSGPRMPGLAPSWASRKVMAKPEPGSWRCPRHTWGDPTLGLSGDHLDLCHGLVALSEGMGWGQVGVMAGQPMEGVVPSLVHAQECR